MARSSSRLLVVLVAGSGISPHAEAAAQGRAGSELGLLGGAAVDAYVDRLVTPFRQSGTGFAGGLEYLRGSVRVALTGSVAGTEAEAGGGAGDVWWGAVQVGWTTAVGEIRGLDVRVGAAAGAVALARRYRYPGQRSTPSEVFGDLVVPLDLTGSLSWTGSGGTSVEESVQVGLLMGMFRSPFAGAKTFPSGRLTGIWDTRSLTHRLMVRHPVSPRVSLLLEHGLELLATDEGRPLRSLRQRMVAGIGIRWGGPP